MKIVIQTQILENYGAHDWDGQGECPQYWKCKGGETYIVPGLTEVQSARVLEVGIPTLTALIERSDTGFRETVIGYDVLADDAAVGEEWENLTNLYWEGGQWIARITTVNDPYGFLRKEIRSKHESYVMQFGGGRGNYSATFTMQDGTTLDYAGLEQFFKEAA